MRNGFVVVADQGSGSISWICSQELGVSFVICFFSFSGSKDFLFGLFEFISLNSKLFAPLRCLADVSLGVAV